MTLAPPSTRRDTRYRLAPEVAVVEWSAPDRPEALVRAPLSAVSVAGLAFRAEGPLDSFRPGGGIDGVSVRFGRKGIHPLARVVGRGR